MDYTKAYLLDTQRKNLWNWGGKKKLDKAFHLENFLVIDIFHYWPRHTWDDTTHGKHCTRCLHWQLAYSKQHKGTHYALTGPGHRSTSHAASSSHRTKYRGFPRQDLALGPENYGESNTQPSPGQFHVCSATKWLEFGTKTDSNKICASPTKFSNVAEHGTVW